MLTKQSLISSIDILIAVAIDVPKPSCNIPAVLVRITKDKSIGQTSCDQVDPSTHSFDQQIKSLLRTQSYGGLQLQLATNDVKSSSNCTTVNGQVQLSMLTSITVTVETPHCGDNISCIQQFNAKQLDTTESFFNYILPFLIGSDSDAEVTLWCSNGTMLTSDGQCCAPGKYLMRSCDYPSENQPTKFTTQCFIILTGMTLFIGLIDYSSVRLSLLKI